MPKWVLIEHLLKRKNTIMERIFQLLSESMHVNTEIKNDLTAKIYIKQALKEDILISEGKICD